ncbi:formate--tetrahydrofolate ligase, partial [Candidatus Bipolaricaulota bacterium]|nr:formate--tetrahydrofolate ligase [Candidatus Bipolaricaulota bacterium]
MPYDPTRLADWEIAAQAERGMPTPDEWGERLGLKREEIIPYGRIAKLDYLKIYERLKARPNGKYIEITAITPTPLGEGKTTTT